MCFFFFGVGLEIKKEVINGSLASFKVSLKALSLLLRP